MTDYCGHCHQKRPCGCDTLFDSVSEPVATLGLTDEHEHAVKLWLYSSGYEGNVDVEQAVREFAAVIAADRAGLVARIAELEGLLAEAYVYCDPLDDDDANDFIDRLRAALKDTRHD